jgi:AraC-like DNA-binding protein
LLLEEIKPVISSENPDPVKQNDLDDEIIKQILFGLDRFEKDLKFLKKDLTIGKLAKILNTNTTYLSKIINLYKGKNFPVYLNDLRIDYIVLQLVQNPLLLKYSINGIAETAGFSNGQHFSNVFFERKGIRPSYFVKELKKVNSNLEKNKSI